MHSVNSHFQEKGHSHRRMPKFLLKDLVCAAKNEKIAKLEKALYSKNKKKMKFWLVLELNKSKILHILTMDSAEKPCFPLNPQIRLPSRKQRFFTFST